MAGLELCIAGHMGWTPQEWDYNHLLPARPWQDRHLDSGVAQWRSSRVKSYILAIPTARTINQPSSEPTMPLERIHYTNVCCFPLYIHHTYVCKIMCISHNAHFMWLLPTWVRKVSNGVQKPWHKLDSQVAMAK